MDRNLIYTIIGGTIAYGIVQVLNEKAKEKQRKAEMEAMLKTQAMMNEAMLQEDEKMQKRFENYLNGRFNEEGS